MNIVNLSEEMLSAFDGDRFDLEKWKSYMDACLPGAKEMCLEDMQETLNAGFSWENDYLPVLNTVICDKARRESTVETFCGITAHLEEKIFKNFHRTLDVDLVLYLGLCNGAGWVTSINGRSTILFGIEKIMELDWCGKEKMTGLIFHELGHVYQEQYGVLRIEPESAPDKFLWQLFTEGVAMVFEQEIAGDPEYFHQYGSEWKQWCDEHADLIKQSFNADLSSMTSENQRYFGDWVSFNGYGDTGYYLGARFVRFLMDHDHFDDIISYDIKEVRTGFDSFLRQNV
ncbi:MAG: hypothetical protein IJS94_04875 [Clostridia bacterium]|nr:hypothetical protein [Clostridia bacterium]